MNQVKNKLQEANSLIMMYQNKNNEQLTQLPDDYLDPLENSLFTLINTIKIEKTLRALYNGMKIAVSARKEPLTNPNDIFNEFKTTKKKLTANPPAGLKDISELLKIEEIEETVGNINNQIKKENLTPEKGTVSK